MSFANPDIALGPIAQNMDLRLLAIFDNFRLDSCPFNERLSDIALIRINKKNFVKNNFRTDFAINLFSIDGFSDFSLYLLSTSKNNCVHFCLLY